VPLDQTLAAETELIEIAPEELPKKVQQLLQSQKLTNKVSDSNAEAREQDFASSTESSFSDYSMDQDVSDYEQALLDSLRKTRPDRPDNATGKKPDTKTGNTPDDKPKGTSQYSYAIIDYDMAGREGTIKNPGYTCRGTGLVRIIVEIDREGVVLSAKIDESVTQAGACPRKQALIYAQRSFFSKNSSADRRQVGTITYNFISQK